MAALILPPAPTPPAVPGMPAATVARLWAAAKDFEAETLASLIKPMFATVDTAKGAFGGGTAEQTWQPLMMQAIGKQMAAAGGIGLAAPVFQAMLRAQEAGSHAKPVRPGL